MGQQEYGPGVRDRGCPQLDPSGTRAAVRTRRYAKLCTAPLIDPGRQHRMRAFDQVTATFGLPLIGTEGFDSLLGM